MKKPEAILVTPCRAVVVSGVDLQEGDKFIVHRVIDSECAMEDSKDIPFSPCGKVITLDMNHNPVMIDMAGYYRIYPDGVVSDTASLYIDRILSCEK